ncbi:zinc finger protein 629-like isoform X14 [Pomacea canaliculata]|uniref:zinc finger protein 629-like isoform X14 n=1 Tax=Pomacea canaliculata TaxID=400727 RepID=UPI000D72DDA7|nr:zinc finger protein 629-like isoform X14 [Pomacea canaliculata]
MYCNEICPAVAWNSRPETFWKSTEWSVGMNDRHPRDDFALWTSPPQQGGASDMTSQAATPTTDPHQSRGCQWGLGESDGHISPGRRFHTSSPLSDLFSSTTEPQARGPSGFKPPDSRSSFPNFLLHSAASRLEGLDPRSTFYRPSSGEDSYFKWSKPHTSDHAACMMSRDFWGALGGDSGGVGGVGEVHRGSVGSVASYCRTSSAGSLSGPPTPTTGGPPNAPGAGPNTPLVIPQPVKPQSRVNKTYQCKMCDQIFNTKSDMLIHCQQIHKQDPKPYKCPTCSKCFANSSYLSQHARIHSGIKPYKCEICERKFTQLTILKQHIRIHTKEKPYLCTHLECGKAFTQLSQLQQHVRTHTNERPFQCMYMGCGKAFTQLTILQQHVRIHTKEKPYHCMYLGCGKSFTQLTQLKQHVRIHTNEKPYSCTHEGCGKTFTQLSQLQQHVRTHTNERPYRCMHQGCGDTFIQLSHLQQHIRTHTGEKPYKCMHPGCGKAFSQLSNLQSHSRSHMTDKPFRCNSCYKCYADEQSLREHIPKHSDTKHLKTHICHICGKSYTQETYLTRHMAKHSQDPSNPNGMGPKPLPHPIKQEPVEPNDRDFMPHPHDKSPTDLGPSNTGSTGPDAGGGIGGGGGGGGGPGGPAGTQCGRSVSSAFMPLSPFPPTTCSSANTGPSTAAAAAAAYHHYGSGLAHTGLTSPLPHISSMASPRYFPYDPIGFRKDAPERNLNMGMGRDSMIANSLLSLQHIKNYASQQMPSFTPTCTTASRLA